MESSAISSQTITRRLSQFERLNEDLLVVSPSEVRRQQVNAPSDALSKFGVNYAVEGSLQSQGNRIRLVLTVVDTRQMLQLDTAVVEELRENALSL